MQEILFKTNRLIVRKWIDSDLSMIQKIYGDTDAMRWVGDGKAITFEESKSWLKVTYKNYDTRGYGMYTVQISSTLEIVGFCGIVHPHNQIEAEIKYAFSREHWGKGIATEAVVGLINYGKQVFGLKKFISTIAPENIASERVLLKVGMTPGELYQDDEGLPTRRFYLHA